MRTTIIPCGIRSALQDALGDIPTAHTASAASPPHLPQSPSMAHAAAASPHALVIFSSIRRHRIPASAPCDRPWSLSPTPVRRRPRSRAAFAYAVRRHAYAHTPSTPCAPGTRRRLSAYPPQPPRAPIPRCPCLRPALSRPRSTCSTHPPFLAPVTDARRPSPPQLV
ncbi:hypothetical protein B0H14DRAFT_2801840 [Mycena olivaceomarginata]|nr:hypothetical protein B0H14DRAFT_2801840 [Mycena olivaceomarginata]